MAKIIIKNFRAIDFAEIEIKPFTVIIGEQASGKSTISKLVYFFKSLPYEMEIAIFKYCHNNFEINKREKISDKGIHFGAEQSLKNELRLKFNKFFSTTRGEIFEISFFENNTSILIKSDNKISINIYFNENIIDIDRVRGSFIFLGNIPNLFSQREFIDNDLQDIITRRNISKLIFIPASRSLISSILPASQSKFTAELGKTVDNTIDFFVKTFLEDIDFFKRNYFFGKSLDEVIDEFELKTGKENLQAKQLRDKIKVILKADYQNGSGGEQLIHKRFSKPVSLDKASSGQQEVIWVLLTLLSLILEDEQSFVVIEEPEAHLYPKTQAKVVEYIAQFFNAKEGNEMILTTHSPYILTVLNNLLFAKQISIKTHGVENQTIAESVDPKAWLDIENFSAYYVGYNDEGQFIKSIINPETGLISVNALDDASDDIMDTFDDLMDIYKGATV